MRTSPGVKTKSRARQSLRYLRMADHGAVVIIVRAFLAMAPWMQDARLRQRASELHHEARDVAYRARNRARQTRACHIAGALLPPLSDSLIRRSGYDSHALAREVHPGRGTGAESVDTSSDTVGCGWRFYSHSSARRSRGLHVAAGRLGADTRAPGCGSPSSFIAESANLLLFPLRKTLLTTADNPRPLRSTSRPLQLIAGCKVSGKCSSE